MLPEVVLPRVLVGELIGTATPLKDGLASAQFVAQSPRWISLQGQRLLEIANAINETDYKRVAFKVFGSDSFSTARIFDVVGAITKKGAYYIRTLTTDARIKFFYKDEGLYIYNSGPSADTFQVCLLSYNTNATIILSSDPTSDGYTEITPL